MESASEKHSEADAPRPGQRPSPQHGSSAPAAHPGGVWWSGGRTPPLQEPRNPHPPQPRRLPREDSGWLLASESNK